MILSKELLILLIMLCIILGSMPLALIKESDCVEATFTEAPVENTKDNFAYFL